MTKYILFLLKKTLWKIIIFFYFEKKKNFSWDNQKTRCPLKKRDVKITFWKKESGGRERKMDQEREVERIGSLTAIEILQHLKEKKVTSQELLSLYLKRANEREALSVNAICLLDEERARERAKRADLDREKGISWGCLHGLPIVVKEINDVQVLFFFHAFDSFL